MRPEPTTATAAPAPGTPPPDGRRILALFRPHRLRLALVGLMIGLSALLGLAQPLLIREAVDVALPERDLRLLVLIVLGMVGAAVLSSGLDVYQTLISNTVGQRVMHRLRTSVYTHLQRMSLAYFTRTRTGDVQSRIGNDIGGVQSVVTSTVTSLVSSFTTVLATFVAMLVLDWRLALVTLVVVPFFVWLARTVGAMRRRITAERQRRLSGMSSLVEETLSISGIVLSRTMGRGVDLSARFDGTSTEVADLEVRSAMAGRWRMATVQIAFAGMPALAYLIGGLAGAGSPAGGSLTIGTLVAFTTLQTRLLFPMLSLLRLGVEVQSSLALFTRVFEVLDTPVDLVEPAAPAPISRADVRGEVRLEHVSFGYEPGVPTLRDVDLTVPAGTTLAVVGATGSGKTTLGYLASRLYDVDSGAVTVDGVDLRDMTLAQRASIVAVVSQETTLLHTTVAENLRFAKPDATDAELESAARDAQVHELISSLPQGYDTMVGERGYRFSGGEKQRLAIARAVLRDPAVLVLDEATSALDTRTERAVQAALDRLAGGRTTIAIAHRLSTVRDADQVVVLDHGRVVERGTHDELVALGGRYAALVAGSDGDDDPDLLAA
ncbi:ABC transporter ATP-binding protein [Rhodococcus aerolatus]